MKTAAARLTEYHARAVAAIGRPADLIGFHGQTILHQPDRSQPGRGRTWQIGDAAWLAWRTGVRVAWDFRSADVAAGGEGAPFAPVYPCGAGGCTAAAVGGAEHRRRGQCDLDRRTDRRRRDRRRRCAAGVRHRPGQRTAGRLGGAPHRGGVRRGQRIGASGRGGSGGARPAAGRSVFYPFRSQIAGSA